MVEYRRFNNSDPPNVLRLWHECGLGRGAAQGLDADVFETVVFAQPYFDREGLILADDGNRVVGFVHAGFCASADETQLNGHEGVICAVMVAPDARRRGIGRELVSRAENYLRNRGVTTIFAGPSAPRDPFYFGIYGGSQPAGFLESDPLTGHFFPSLGYRPVERNIVFQRSLEEKGEPVGVRLMGVRRATKLASIPPRLELTWWWQTRPGRLDTLSLSLVPKAGGEPLADVVVIGLDYYLPSWQQRSIGLLDLFVPEDQRRKGYAQALLVEVCRRVKTDLITLVEAHVPEDNVAGIKTLRSAGFHPVDAGVVYCKG